MNKESYISPDIMFLEIVNEGIICDSAFASDSEDIVLFSDDMVL